MKLYYLDEDKQPYMADVVQTGNVLVVTGAPEAAPLSIIQAAVGIALSYASVSNMNCSDFVADCVYVEQLNVA